MIKMIILKIMEKFPKCLWVCILVIDMHFQEYKTCSWQILYSKSIIYIYIYKYLYVCM